MFCFKEISAAVLMVLLLKSTLIRKCVVCGISCVMVLSLTECYVFRFNRFMALVLLVGNYMNSGSRNARSLGFDINYVTKVSCGFISQFTL